MIPEMDKANYPRAFSSAVTAVSSTTGLLIPPSNILIIYAIASGGVSISSLFIAGYVPGLLLGLALMFVCAIYATKMGIKTERPLGIKPSLLAIWRAQPALALVVIVMGGIVSGAFTPTEAGAIAVIYSLLLSVAVYKEVNLSQRGDILANSVKTTAIVMFLIATSSALSWLLAYENIPQLLTDAMLGISENPLILLLIINLILLMVGALMDMTPPF